MLVNAEGRYFVDDREVLRTDVESLKQTLVDVAGNDRDRPVLLRADGRTPHQAVVTALDALGQLGFSRVSIATAPPVSAAGRRPVTASDRPRRPGRPTAACSGFAEPYRRAARRRRCSAWRSRRPPAAAFTA